MFSYVRIILCVYISSAHVYVELCLHLVCVNVSCRNSRAFTCVSNGKINFDWNLAEENGRFC